MTYESSSFMFRSLNDKEEEAFRKWARKNWSANTQVKEIWHPVVREEWEILDKKNA